MHLLTKISESSVSFENNWNLGKDKEAEIPEQWHMVNVDGKYFSPCLFKRFLVGSLRSTLDKEGDFFFYGKWSLIRREEYKELWKQLQRVIQKP